MKRRNRAVPRNLWLLPNPGFDALHYAGFLGFGSRIGIIDTGCKLGSTVRRGIQDQFIKDFTSPTGRCEDEVGHGTVVASVIKRYAPGAQLVVAKVGIDISAANSLRVVKALEWVYECGINVVNLSLGFPIGSCLRGTCPLCQMIEGVAKKGIVPVVAAGNRDKTPTICCPGISEYSLTIGAVNTEGQIAEYSVKSVGGRAKPDLVASGTVHFADGAVHVGTSFAAPAVSAAIAVIGSRIGYTAATRLLKQTARSIPGDSDHPTGHGLIDLKRAGEVATSAGATDSIYG